MRFSLFCFLALMVACSWAQTLRAGSAKVDASLPLGVPLAGYNHGDRRSAYWPIPYPGEYTTWMTGATGIMDPTWAKAVCIDDSKTAVCFVTLDGIGADGTLCDLAFDLAGDMGFPLRRGNVIFSASHTHSGPGAVSPEFLWEFAPATDLMVPKLQLAFATSIAKALATAYTNLAPAQLDLGLGSLIGATKNRRSRISPFVNTTTIDPNLGVIRVDDMSGHPIATIWNFAVHGTCYGPSNMQFSGDIMGKACQYVEQTVGGIALFINSDAGDIDPADGMCDGAPAFVGSSKMASAVVDTRLQLLPTTEVEISAYSQFIPFGLTDLNATLGRFSNCTEGGILDICTLCATLDCDLNAHLPESWVEETPLFSAFRITTHGNNDTLIVSIPGEALVELGWWIRNDTKALGFEQTFLAGYSQSHMGYFATPDEYDIGGYESQLTFWGVYTANKIRSSCKTVASHVVR